MKTLALITAAAVLTVMQHMTPAMAQVDSEPDPHFGPAQEGGRSEATPGYSSGATYYGTTANGYYMSEPVVTGSIKPRRHTTPQQDQEKMPSQGSGQR